ncbi:unnamed protein product [Scytosiphon promiscuus]
MSIRSKAAGGRQKEGKMAAGGHGASRPTGAVRRLRGERGAPSLRLRSTFSATEGRSYAAAPSLFVPVLSAVVLLPLLLGGTVSAFDNGLPDGLKVVHANVIMRHGQRSRLAKSTAMEFGDNAGVMLTDLGELECFDLGVQLRERYMPSADTPDGTTTTIDGLTLWYDHDRVEVVSSGYDRTLESAAAMNLGLYPENQNDTDVQENVALWNDQIVVPIHASLPENDIEILAFNKCPVYDDNWVEAYEEDEFQELQAVASEPYIDGSDGFITQVYNEFAEFQRANNNPDCWDEVEALYENLLELHAPYNLWDCARTLAAVDEMQTVNFINAAEIPPEMADQNEDVSDGFTYLEYLVHWVEDFKYRQSVVGRMIGGPYLTSMNLRMSQVIEHIRSGYQTNVGRYPGMHITSGHYGTLKGIAGALDIDEVDGIPDYASHFSFELLHNATADYTKGEDDFAVRIMFQEGTSKANLTFVNMGIIYDGEESIADLDEVLSSERDDVHGVMGWNQWGYLMEHQVSGGPAVYPEGDEEWCMDCLATQPNTCISLELKLMTQKWEEADVATQDAIDDKEAVDDGIGGTHLALLSVFGLILGIGCGICLKPWVDRHNKKIKSSSGSIAGESGLEAWSSSAATSNNGSFRLGAKSTPNRGRHVMGAVDSRQMMAVPTADNGSPDASRMKGDIANGGGHSDEYDVEDDAGGARIPEFAPTSALGEPVPFPHRRQPSGMVTGVDSSMMSGIDAEDDVEDDVMGGAASSPAGKAEPTSTATASTQDETVLPNAKEETKEEV